MIILNKKGALKLLGLFACKPEAIAEYARRIENATEKSGAPSLEKIVERCGWDYRNDVLETGIECTRRRRLLMLVLRENLGVTAAVLAKTFNVNRSNVYVGMYKAHDELVNGNEAYSRDYQSILNALK